MGCCTIKSLQDARRGGLQHSEQRTHRAQGVGRRAGRHQPHPCRQHAACQEARCAHTLHTPVYMQYCAGPGCNPHYKLMTLGLSISSTALSEPAASDLPAQNQTYSWWEWCWACMQASGDAYAVAADATSSGLEGGGRVRRILIGHSLGAACAAAEVIDHPEVRLSIAYGKYGRLWESWEKIWDNSVCGGTSLPSV